MLMRELLLQLMMAMLLLVSFLADGGLSRSPPNPPAVSKEPTEERCPPCELFFRKLEGTGDNGKLTQVVRVQERGEPKSGTGFMFDWATGALMRTCNYLQRLYGETMYALAMNRTGHTNMAYDMFRGCYDSSSRAIAD